MLMSGPVRNVSKRLRFGGFVLDLSRAELTRGVARVALRPKAFTLLEVLTLGYRYAGPSAGVVTRHLLDGAQLEAAEGCSVAVTVIQRFGSAAKLQLR
jgi:hypothetical protein